MMAYWPAEGDKVNQSIRATSLLKQRGSLILERIELKLRAWHDEGEWPEGLLAEGG